MTRLNAIAAALVLTAIVPAHAAEGWRYGLTGDVVHDNNATRGLYDGKKSDNIAVVEGSATRSWLLSPNSGALFRAAARYSHFMDIDDISNLALIARGAWRYQPTRGYSAPWFELAGQAQVLQNRWHLSLLVHVRQHSPPAATPQAVEHVEVERPPEKLGPVSSRRLLPRHRAGR